MTTYISKHAKSSFGIILLSGTNFSDKDISSLDNIDKGVLTDLLHETLEQAFRSIRADDSYISTDDSKLFQFIQYSVKVLTVHNRFSYAFFDYMNKCYALNQQRNCHNSLQAQHVGQPLPKRQRSDFAQISRPVAMFNRMTQLECEFLNNPDDHTDFLVGSYWETCPREWFRYIGASSTDIGSTNLSVQFPKGKPSMENDTCLRDTIRRELEEETGITSGFHFIARHDLIIDMEFITAIDATIVAADKIPFNRVTTIVIKEIAKTACDVAEISAHTTDESADITASVSKNINAINCAVSDFVDVVECDVARCDAASHIADVVRTAVTHVANARRAADAAIATVADDATKRIVRNAANARRAADAARREAINAAKWATADAAEREAINAISAADTATAAAVALDDRLCWRRSLKFNGMNFAIAIKDENVELGRTDVHNNPEIDSFAWISLKDACGSMEAECDYPEIIYNIIQQLVITFNRIAREHGHEDILKKLESLRF